MSGGTAATSAGHMASSRAAASCVSRMAASLSAEALSGCTADPVSSKSFFALMACRNAGPRTRGFTCAVDRYDSSAHRHSTVTAPDAPYASSNFKFTREPTTQVVPAKGNAQSLSSASTGCGCRKLNHVHPPAVGRNPASFRKANPNQRVTPALMRWLSSPSERRGYPAAARNSRSY